MSDKLLEVSMKATTILGLFINKIDTGLDEDINAISDELYDFIKNLSKEDTLICFLHYMGIIKSLTESLGVDTEQKLSDSILDPIFLEIIKLDYEQKKQKP